MSFNDDDEKKLSGVESRVTLDEGGGGGGGLYRLWLRDEERWYPTLRKTVWILEQLRDFVQVWLLLFFSFLLMNSFSHPQKNKACDIPRYRTRSASAMSSIAGDGEREYYSATRRRAVVWCKRVGRSAVFGEAFVGVERGGGGI